MHSFTFWKGCLWSMINSSGSSSTYWRTNLFWIPCLQVWLYERLNLTFLALCFKRNIYTYWRPFWRKTYWGASSFYLTDAWRSECTVHGSGLTNQMDLIHNMFSCLETAVDVSTVPFIYYISRHIKNFLINGLLIKSLPDSIESRLLNVFIVLSRSLI